MTTHIVIAVAISLSSNTTKRCSIFRYNIFPAHLNTTNSELLPLSFLAELMQNPNFGSNERDGRASNIQFPPATASSTL